MVGSGSYTDSAPGHRRTQEVAPESAPVARRKHVPYGKNIVLFPCIENARQIVRSFQEKIRAWREADEDIVYRDLFNLAISPASLMLAWRRVAVNSGSSTPGVDERTVQTVLDSDHGEHGFLLDIYRQLKTGTYTPQPVRLVEIPKSSDPTQKRPLGIPVISDRVVQGALLNVLDPIFDPTFYDCSYGFRQNRSALNAVAATRKLLSPSGSDADVPSPFEFVIVGDVQDAFGSVDHELLLNLIRLHLRDKKLLDLIERFLAAKIFSEGLEIEPDVGLPQGAVLSPLLMNVMLHELDDHYCRWIQWPYEDTPHRAWARREWDRRKRLPVFVPFRYADDFRILCASTEEEAETEKLAMERFLDVELHLTLNMGKTKVQSLREPFDFLGYRFHARQPNRSDPGGCELSIPPEAITRKIKRLQEKIDLLQETLPDSEIFNRCQESVKGWRNYYNFASNRSTAFNQVEDWLIQEFVRRR